MNEQMQTCKRCGEVKPLSQFRKYYGNRKGHYTYCLECERIETRRKYLAGKKLLTPDELYELQSIENLYDVRAKHGLNSPNRRSSKSKVRTVVEQQLAKMVSVDEGV